VDQTLSAGSLLVATSQNHLDFGQSAPSGVPGLLNVVPYFNTSKALPEQLHKTRICLPNKITRRAYVHQGIRKSARVTFTLKNVAIDRGVKN